MRPTLSADRGKERAEAKAGALAAAQRGLIRRAQALGCGMSRHQIDWCLKVGRWIVVLPGVYSVGPADGSIEERLQAALLWAGEDWVLSHRSAAWVWGCWDEHPSLVELSGPTGKKTVPGLCLHGKRQLLASETRLCRGLPVTSIDRTLLDIAAVTRPPKLEASLDKALYQRLTAIPRLDAYLQIVGGRGQRGTKPLRKLIDERSGKCGPSESELERKFLSILKEYKLPMPDQQTRVPTPLGLARVDFLFTQFKLRVETDGYRWHFGKEKFVRDRRLDNHFTRAGWRNLHYTWWDMNERRKSMGEELSDVLFSRLPI